MAESKRPGRSSKRPPRIPGPPPAPATSGSPNPKRINLRDLRQPNPAVEPSGRETLGEALVLARRNEERAVLAESERDEARADAQAARSELSALQKRVARLEAELALVRAGTGTGG